MGWDLVPVSRVEPIHVNMHWWLHVVANALEHLGADMDFFGYTNDGDYVPADVARTWADTLEKGMDDLKIAYVHHAGDPPFVPGEAVLVVHKSYTEEQAMEDFKREVGWFQGEALTFRGFEDLRESDRKLLAKFIRFCRCSRGFYQY